MVGNCFQALPWAAECFLCLGAPCLWCLERTAGILGVHAAASVSSRSHHQLLQNLDITRTKFFENFGDHVFLIATSHLCLMTNESQNLATEHLPSMQKNAENILG